MTDVRSSPMRRTLPVVGEAAPSFAERVALAQPHPAAWPSPYDAVANGPLPPHVSIRDGRALVVDPDSGYWEVVPAERARAAADTIAARAAALGVTPPDPRSYDSDYYPLECVLYLTNKCNMSCTYCYSTEARKADWRDFDWTLLKKGIRMLLREPRRQSLCFLLFGGESLVAFDLMQRVVDYVHTVNRCYGKSITFRMQTNGSLLTEDKLRWLVDNQVQVGISLDGPEEIHDRGRRTLGGQPTFRDVMRGVELLQRHALPFSCIATVGRPEDLVPVFQFFTSRQITQRVKISPLLPEGAARASFATFADYAEEWGRQNLVAARHLLEHNRTSAYRVREGNLFAMITHLVRDHRPDLCLRTPCGAAYGMVEFHPDGSFVTCDKTLYSPELGTVASLKDIPETTSLLDLLDTSPLIAAIRSRTVDTIPKCSHCAVKRHCGGSCTLGSYDFFKDFHREDVMCAYRRFMFEELMWMMGSDPSTALWLAAPEYVA